MLWVDGWMDGRQPMQEIHHQFTLFLRGYLVAAELVFCSL
jgi:hypothetical protein